MTRSTHHVEQPLPRDQANFLWVDGRQRKMHGAPPAPVLAPMAAAAAVRKRERKVATAAYLEELSG